MGKWAGLCGLDARPARIRHIHNVAVPAASHPSSTLTPEAQRNVLLRAAQLLASASGFEEVLRQTIAACLPGLADFGFFDALDADGQVRRTVAAHQAPDIEALLAPTRWVEQHHPELNLCALSTGQAGLHPDTDDPWYRRVAAGEDHLALLRRLAFRSMVTVPMRWRGEVLGALTLFMGRSGRRHDQADLEFASALADLAAPLVANARLLKQHERTERALRVSEERLRMAVDAGQVGIWDWDIAANHIEWSDRVFELHGLSRDEDPDGLDGWRRLVDPEDRPSVEAALADSLATGAPYAVEFRSRMPDGSVRWLAARGHVLRDAEGRPQRMVGALTDITERVDLLAAERLARGEAEAARRRLELLARAGEVLARSLDPQETLDAVARTLVPEVADWCRIDLLDEHGQLQRRLAHHSDPKRSRAALEMVGRIRPSATRVGSMGWVVATGRSWYGDSSAPETQADPATAEFTRTFGMRSHFILPLVARGRTIGAMGVLQAESGRRLHAEDRALVQELARRAALALDNARLFGEAGEARRQAEAASQAKDEFLAMLGHELRNPLAPITTALELMRRRAPDSLVDERRILERQVRHLSRLIDDLLDISRIARGKVALKRERVDLRAVVKQALEMTRPHFEGHEHAVQVQLPAEPAWVEGDPVRLAQVLANLLVNAAKFTPADGRVRVELRADSQRHSVRVIDTGCGIPPELLPKVFDQFVQGRQASDRRFGGLGLGLAIARSLAERHGGSVHAASAGVGAGATFTVELPAASAAAQVPQPSPPPAGAGERRGARILVVDDNTDAALTLAHLLHTMGYQARTAPDARAAVREAQSFRPDLGLLDIGLPGVDGYELAGQLRSLQPGPGLRLVALTGYGQEADRQRALAAGFDEHLTKPVDADRLARVVEGQLRLQAQAAASAWAQAHPLDQAHWKL